MGFVLWAFLFSGHVIAQDFDNDLDQKYVYNSLEEALKAPDQVYRLHLNHCLFTKIPFQVFKFQNLEDLELNFGAIEKIDPRILKLSKLRRLSLAHNALTEIPEWIGKLTHLKYLYFDYNELEALPRTLEGLDLAVISLRGNQIHSVPFAWSAFPNLKRLNIANNKFGSVRMNTELVHLEVLLAMTNQITGDSLPNFQLVPHLRILGLGSNPLRALPRSLSVLEELEELDLTAAQLSSFPAHISKLSSLQYLHLANNGLTSLPLELESLSGLRYLDLTNNSFASIPPCIFSLKGLETLGLSKNRVKEIPPDIMTFTQLKRLFLCENKSLTKLSPWLLNLEWLDTLCLENTSLEMDNLLELVQHNTRTSIIVTDPEQGLSFGLPVLAKRDRDILMEMYTRSEEGDLAASFHLGKFLLARSMESFAVVAFQQLAQRPEVLGTVKNVLCRIAIAEIYARWEKGLDPAMSEDFELRSRAFREYDNICKTKANDAKSHEAIAYSCLQCYDQLTNRANVLDRQREANISEIRYLAEKLQNWRNSGAEFSKAGGLANNSGDELTSSIMNLGRSVTDIGVTAVENKIARLKSENNYLASQIRSLRQSAAQYMKD